MVCKRFGAASFLSEIHAKIVIFKKRLSFMLCAKLIYSDPVTYILVLTHLIKYFKCSLYYDTLIIQIDLVVAETHSVNYRAEAQNKG